MSHFTNDVDAIILGSYDDQYGGGNKDDWSVMFCDSGFSCSWYHTKQLTFIRHAGEEEIHRIREAKEERDKQKSDIDWILANWKEIRAYPPQATMDKLMAMIGIRNPWGSRGDGMTYHANMIATLNYLDPVLMTGDKEKLTQFLDANNADRLLHHRT